MKIQNLKGDIFGGITAGIVALPLALAFGVQSGLGASAGLYGAMALGLFAAIFGGTNTQISGPTGPMTVVSASIASAAIAQTGAIESAWGIIILTFALSGVFQIIFGLLKIGKYIKYIPYPVLSGFMTGIGVIIIFFQLLPAIGLSSPSKIVNVVMEFPSSIPHANTSSLLLSISTILIIYLFPKITKAVPSTLVAIIVMTLVGVLLKLDCPLIGEMPSGLPLPKFSAIASADFSQIGGIIIPALTLAGLGTIDSLLTSVVADNITSTKHNSNKELMGQGIGNIASALIGGIPGAGATMRTVVNVKSGGKTRLSGIIHAILLLLIIIGLGKYVSYIPLSVLAGILITVGISIIDFKGLKSLLSIPRSDAVILIIVLGLTVFVDLLQAVGIGMIISSLVFMRKASDMVETNTSLNKIDEKDREASWEDESKIKLRYDHVYIKHFDGPIFFGMASKIMERVNKIPNDAKIVIFRMQRVPYIDQSGLYALEEVIKKMHNNGIKVVISMMQDQPRHLFTKNHIIPDVIPNDLLFNTIEDCAEWLKKEVNRKK